MKQKIMIYVDEMGRIEFPSTLMRQLGWNPGDSLEFKSNNDMVVISLNEKHNGMVVMTKERHNCTRRSYCSKFEQMLHNIGTDACKTCIESIREFM